MSSTKSGRRPTRWTHSVPRYYLEGFCDGEHPGRVWVYRLPPPPGAPPRSSVRPPHPVRIENVTVERDRYAVTTPSGRIEYETVENQLARQEGLANPILRKLRAKKTVSPAEKRVLATYISQMHRRVQRTDARRRELAQNAARSMDWEAIAQSAKNAGESERAQDVIRNRQRYEAEAAENIRKLGTVVALEEVEAHLCAMRWRFLCAPDPEFFVTGDCPVLLGEGFGLAHAQAVVVFPIASKVALWASWESEEDLVYADANESNVYLVNSITIRSAHREIYARENTEWVLTELELQAAERERAAARTIV